jgi:hypothetical protein
MDWFERRGCEDETKDCVPAYEAQVFDPTLNLEWPSPLILRVTIYNAHLGRIMRRIIKGSEKRMTAPLFTSNRGTASQWRRGSEAKT